MFFNNMLIPVPEPGGMVLLAAGCAWLRRRKIR
ncbi:MAG: PEP-CTERM sorting domain-containing protein [Sedimentisphaerales bacterium]|nr:PEP-CTERM sorting domain-containing protein [Sedimentisphaerales bacterium]